MVEEEDYEVELPPAPEFARGQDMGLIPGPPPEDQSAMQKAIVDGAKPVEGNVWAYQTNEGTVFIASPADMARSILMDDAFYRVRRGPTYLPTNAQIDKLMKED